VGVDGKLFVIYSGNNLGKRKNVVAVTGGWLAVCVTEETEKLKKKFICFPTHYDHSCPLLIDYTDVKN
jgi:hypothetical protein